MVQGLIVLPWWGYVLVALALTHITIASVTIYLHRHQTHRALDLHPAVAHVFRLWLWLTTGMVTKAWVAIHRKHHARCETEEDPHSPQVLGLRKVLWQGAELYRAEAKNAETLAKFGHNTPDDWLERHVYTRHSASGIVVTLILNVLCFGPLGLTIWAVQMAWIPFFAAGIVNGVGHYYGYRNFECADAATNIVPIGILIGGEELHNNHHTYASSAKFSCKPWELDIGWGYIRALEALGLATVKKVAPIPTYTQPKEVCDLDTVRAVIHHRFEVMARFAREVLHEVHGEEVRKAAAANRQTAKLLKGARRLMVREKALIGEAGHRQLQEVLAANSTLHTVYTMKERLQDVWRRSASSQEQLREALQDWCHQAEATGIQALSNFATAIRSYAATKITA
ncbi:fatty acid desaturase [Acidiferrobacter sp.]|uniref:DesA family fatty acid desaturase n=1 Tax=Acidiferrobacter sp. TaxID=1872107 RepID=UPI002633867B|nr:fatty acid desaturase [Acidiferrobacter sp.]